MPNPTPNENRQQISLPAEGEVLHAIRRHSEAHGVGLGRAAFDMINAAIRADWTAPDELPVDPIDLDAMSVANLLAEIGRRFAAADRTDVAVAELTERAEAAEARADTAEGTLASLRDSLRGLVS